MKKIIAVSAGLLEPKKGWNTLNYKNVYLNYGLLGLCTILEKNNNEVVMYQSDYNSPNGLIKLIQENVEINLNTADILLLSLPSYYSIEWVSEFCKDVRKISNIKIYAGGRWVVGSNQDWIKDKISEIDVVLKGFGEDYIIECIDSVDVICFEPKDLKTRPFNNLNYNLLYNFKKYQPCIELSRGCGNKCKFCVEGNIPLTKMKRPNSVIEEIIEINKLYGNSMNYYFEASHFYPTEEWANEFLEMYKLNNIKSEWRCETRVDSISPKIISILAKAGLKVIDIGLESASKTQLMRMGKCTNVEEYLEKANSLLETCKENGILTKVNILLYVGENEKTTNETLVWLDKRKDSITGVSVNPLVVYGYDSDLSFVGVEDPKDTSYDVIKENGFLRVNLSDYINLTTVDKIMREISQRFMTAENYYNLKKYSYFSTDYSYSTFLNDVERLNEVELPFKK